MCETVFCGLDVLDVLVGEDPETQRVWPRFRILCQRQFSHSLSLSLSLSAYEFYDLSTFLSLLFALLINLNVPFCMCVFTGEI